MGLEPGTRVGDWIVEHAVDERDRYRCHRIDTPFRKAVLRVLRAADAEDVAHEADRLARLHHPNIQGVLGIATSGDDLYLVTEAVEGAFLDAFVTDPPLPVRAALDVALQLADALAQAHTQGIVHGEVRPENVLLTGEGRAKLIGFSLRSSQEAAAEGGVYRPPEHGSAPWTTEGDAYALGVLLLEILSGARVPVGTDPAQVARGARLHLPELRDLVLALCGADPGRRPTLSETRDALDRVLRTSLDDGATPMVSAATTFTDMDPAGTPTPAAAPQRIGRYRVVRELGRGGAGVVYEADDPVLRRRVALKILLAGAFAGTRDVERFLREARAVARLDHPGIVKLLEHGRGDTGAWFAMEYVDGPTLLARITDGGPLDWRVAAALARDLANALQHAHDHGVVHRDVKPSNVLLEADGRPRLTDFGLALGDDDDTQRLTRTGQVLGTPMYMAPEQAVGDVHLLGPHTDTYALGVVLYEALTARVPFDGAGPLQVIGQVLKGEPTAPRSHRPSIPRDLELVCLKAMRRDIGDRYGSAEALAHDLDRCLRGEPVIAAVPTLRARARWFARRNRGLLGGAAIAVAAIVAAMVGVGWMISTQLAGLAAERVQTAAKRWTAIEGRMSALEGDHRAEEADQLWSTFADNPDHRGTPALVDGWLRRAETQASRGRTDLAQRALARAYANAGQPDGQARSLLALADHLQAQGEIGRLPMLVDTLRRRVPSVADRPDVRRLARAAAAGHRDFALAATLDDGNTPMSRVIASFRAATDTGHRADELRAWPGGDAAFMLRQHQLDEVVLLAAEPRLGVVRTLRLPVPLAARAALPLAGEPVGLIATAHRGGTVLLERDDDAFRVVGTWPERPVNDAVSADLDGDGRVEHYYGVDRALYRLRRAPDGTWLQDVPHRPTNEANSVIEAIVQADLDGDGVSELVVSAAEWGAYDVRVLAGARGAGELDLLARHKLGVVTDLGVWWGSTPPSLLASKHDRYPNARVFPADRPMGAAQGVYLLGLRGNTLEAEQLAPGLACGAPFSGDLDGDGAPEIVLGCDDDLVVWTRGDGEAEMLRIRDTRPLAVTNLDDDLPDELVVGIGGAVWVLGAGADRAPLIAPDRPPSHEPPRFADGAFQAAWQRAEDLATIGQSAEAAAAMRALADLEWGSPEGTAALLRAGDLHAERLAWLEAAETYLQTAELGRPEEGLPAAARSFSRARALEREYEVLSELRDRGWLDDEAATRLARLQPLADPPTVEWRFDEPLDPRWRILDPLAFRRRADGLRIEAYGDSVLARTPFAWDGEYLVIEADVKVHSAEWDGGLEIALVPRGWGDPPYGVRMSGRGGGEIVTPWATCSVGGSSVRHQADVARGPLRLQVRVFPKQEGLGCSVASGAEVLWRVLREDPLPAPFGEEWELVLRATGQPDTLAVVDLQRLKLVGAQITSDEPAAHPSATARHALVGGDPAEASRVLDAWSEGDDPPLRVAIAAASADPQRLRGALLTTLAAGDDKPVLHLLHARIAEHGTDLRAVLGADYWLWLWRAWGTTLYAQRTDAELLAPVLAQLDGVETAQPRHTEEAVALIELLALRGHHLVGQGRDAAAVLALDRALALHAALGASADPEARGNAQSLDAVGALVQVDRAIAQLRTEGPDTAFPSLRAALHTSPSPVVTADHMAARAELAPLADDPRWAALMRAAVVHR